MKLSDFDFDLPEHLIATRPAVPRSSSRLLVAGPDRVHDRVVTDLVEVLRAGDVLVLNDTKVIPARLFGHREREGNVSKMEVTLLSPDVDGNWRALVKPLRKVRDGEAITFAAGLEAQVLGREDGQATLRFNLQGAEFDAAPDQVERITKLSDQLTMGQLTRLWQILTQSHNEVRLAPAPLAAAEMGMLKLAVAGQMPPPELAAQIIEQAQKAAKEGGDGLPVLPSGGGGAPSSSMASQSASVSTKTTQCPAPHNVDPFAK